MAVGEKLAIESSIFRRGSDVAGGAIVRLESKLRLDLGHIVSSSKVNRYGQRGVDTDVLLQQQRDLCNDCQRRRGHQGDRADAVEDRCLKCL